MSDIAYMMIVGLMGLAVGLVLGLTLHKSEQPTCPPLPPLQTPPSLILKQQPIKAVALPEFLNTHRKN